MSNTGLSTIAALVLAIAAVPAGADQITDIKTEAGEKFFHKECYRCHSVDADRDSYGPLLTGVVGRRAGTHDGYPYSEALAQAGFVWTPGALKAWMMDNDGFLPGTKMRHVGISDPTVLDFIVSYLGSISD
ncbi:MAG: c-type cytochrome [Pseudomonadota bacterium]|nr:c-type cytochrome [Pseudomonadota bacterium]